MPKVSIIVPVYNTEKYIGDCIQSILQQSLKDIELILVNDCSTDHSIEILKQYKQNDNRITIIDLPENMGVGVGGARNKGIELSSGEFISFIDLDDVIKSDMLENLYAHAKKDNAEIVLCYKDNLSLMVKRRNYPLNLFTEKQN